VRAAKRRFEVIQRDLVGQVDDRESQGHLRALSAQQVVRTRAEIEDIKTNRGFFDDSPDHTHTANISKVGAMSSSNRRASTVLKELSRSSLTRRMNQRARGVGSGQV